MLLRKKLLAVVFLAVFSMLGFFPNPSAAEETYIYERMWPSLQQPWYFDPYGIAIDASHNLYLTDSINEKVIKLNSEGQLITEWKSADDDGLPWNPSGIAISDDQYVYVADKRHSCIKKFTVNAQYISQWGTSGSGDSQFNFIDYESDDDGGYIAIDAVGNVYVADTLNHRIQKFKPDGVFIKKWGTYGTGNGEFNGPAALAIDASGYVYVVDGFNDRIQKFTTDGVFIKKWGSHGDQPGQFNFWQHPQDPHLSSTGITIDNDGNIVVVDNENYRIQKFDPEGNFLSMWGGIAYRSLFDSPGGIVIDATGNIYVADGSKRIVKFTTDGTLLTQWGSSGDNEGEFRKPLGVGVDASGNIYVGDTSNFRIQKFNADGQFISQIDVGGDNYWQMWGMAVDGDGTVYAVGVSALCAIEDCEHSVKKFDSGGALVTEWGEYGSGNGQFIIWEKPTDIALDGDHNVYVIDIGNDRIQKFTPNGTFITAWGGHGTGVGQFDFLQHYGAGIAIDQSGGFLYVVGGGDGRVQKFDLTGTPLLEWNSYGDPAEELLVIQAVTVDNDGNVLVNFVHPPFGSSYSGGIMKFSSAGQFIAEYLELGSGPGQVYQPHDMVVDSTGRLHIAEDEFNRIQTFKKVDTLPNDRAIIVAGGGPYPGNNLWDATQMCANFAYRTLTMQGYTKQNIFYLSSDVDLDLDNNGEPDDVDGNATGNNLEQAIKTWAAGAASLVLYLVDHGGEHTFRMSGTETLVANDLDAWLDTLQASISGNLIVVYDACESGTFQEVLIQPADEKRIVITSTSPGESAYFVSQGMVSFSNYFWTHIFNGSHVEEAFDLAKTSIAVTTNYQHPLMDAGGITEDIYIGSGNVVGGDDPVIGSVSADQLITDTNITTIWASSVTDGDGISRVWATIRPPDYNQGSADNPVQDLPSIEFLPTGGNHYEVTYDGFNIEGTYQLAIYARDRVGNTSVPSLTSVSVNNPMRRRAVILAGGPASGPLWPAVANCALMAYSALRFQGYTDDDILFMSPDTSPSGVDAFPTEGNLSYALNVWARTDTQDVVVYLVGNGGHETFHLNESETLSPTHLDTWLDGLQNTIPGKLTFVYDADFSGSFLPLLMPPANRQRILIASTDANGTAHFALDGNISFSSFFWQKVINGDNLRDTFVHVTNAIGYALQGQEPVLDDSGNGLGNEPGVDGRLARYYILGAGIVLAGDDPLIGTICPDQILTGEASAQIWVEDVTTTGSITDVWAVITLQDKDDVGGSGNSTDILPLSPVGNGRFEGTYSGFTLFGKYDVSLYAMDDQGNVSQPRETSVFQKVGSDLYEVDNTSNQARAIVINLNDSDSLPQRHSFHDAGDQDWVKFYGIQDEPYEIKVDNVGSNCDVAITVYGADGTTVLAERNIGFEGEGELLVWTCPQNGLYYIMIQHSGNIVTGFGENAEYELYIYRPVGILISLLVKGIVKDANTGLPVEAAVLTTSDNASAVTLPNGSYKIPHPPGIWTFTIGTAQAGYPSTQYPGIEVSGEFETIIDFMIYPDTDGDGANDAEDYCPDDINKTVPGICGCGQTDDDTTDTDSDGAPDCIDAFDDDPNEWADTDLDGLGNTADSDDDGDGISDTMEASAPYGGDSNQDGVPDGLQNRVASFQAYTGSGFVVIESPYGTTLSNCHAADNPSTTDMPPDLSFPFGFFDFTIEGIGLGGSAALKITLPADQLPTTYYKYGLTPLESTDHWYEFLYDFQTGAQIVDNVITLYFTDALQGDDVLLQEDSMVIDLGGPAFSGSGGGGGGGGGNGGGGGGGCFVWSVAD